MDTKLLNYIRKVDDGHVEEYTSNWMAYDYYKEEFGLDNEE